MKMGKLTLRDFTQKVISNLAWLKNPPQTMLLNSSRAATQPFLESGPGQEPIFNVSYFKRQEQKDGQFTMQMKMILANQPQTRSEKDVAILRNILVKLKLFSKLPESIREELARIIIMVRFDTGRTIVKQGDRAASAYVLLSGEVGLFDVGVDASTGIKRSTEMSVLQEGEHFGHLALSLETRRNITAITKKPCEFIMIEQEDFEDLMAPSCRQQWQDMYSFLQRHPFFKDWTNEQVQKCCFYCKMEEYAKDSIILKNNKEPLQFVHFIKSGTCRVVREMHLLHKPLRHGGSARILPPDSLLQTSLHSDEGKIQKHYMQVCLLEQGHCFGLGENVEVTHLITATKVECILVPRTSLLQHNNGKSLNQLRESLQLRFPRMHEVYQRHLQDLKWQKYKRRVVEEVVQLKTRGNETRLEDVPYVIRNGDIQ